MGRPTKMTDGTLDKLCEAYRWGCSDREACLHAEIAPSTLYEYQKENPEFSEQKRLWQSRPTMIARATVVEALQFDPQLSLKYLERKLPEEFYVRRDTKLSSEIDGKAASLRDILDRAGEMASWAPETLKEVPRAPLPITDITRMLQEEERAAAGKDKAAQSAA